MFGLASVASAPPACWAAPGACRANTQALGRTLHDVAGGKLVRRAEVQHLGVHPPAVLRQHPGQQRAGEPPERLRPPEAGVHPALRHQLRQLADVEATAGGQAKLRWCDGDFAGRRAHARVHHRLHVLELRVGRPWAGRRGKGAALDRAEHSVSAAQTQRERPGARHTRLTCAPGGGLCCSGHGWRPQTATAEPVDLATSSRREQFPPARRSHTPLGTPCRRRRCVRACVGSPVSPTAGVSPAEQL